MNHPSIEENQVVDRYLREELEGVELAEFEDHLISCERCLAELEAEERLGQAVRSLAATESLPLSWQRRATPWIWAASIIIALLPAWWLYREGELTANRVREDRVAAEHLANRHEAELSSLRGQLQAAAAERLEATRGASSDPISESSTESRVAELKRELDLVKNRLDTLTRPQSSIATLRLEPIRSSNGGGQNSSRSAYLLSLTEKPEWVVLIFEPHGDEDVAYRLDLEGPDGTSLWAAKNLSPDGYGQVVIQLHSTWLATGVHHLKLAPEGSSPGEELESRLEVLR